MIGIRLLTVVMVVALPGATIAEQAFMRAELIFPLEKIQNHASCLVECSNGDLLVCWYHGSGEQNADDTQILGARRVKKTGNWSAPFTMADTARLPDANPCMVIDQDEKLWLFWPAIQSNSWESALMKYKTSTGYMTSDGPPEWDWQEVMHIRHPGNFHDNVKDKLNEYFEDIELDSIQWNWIMQVRKQARDKLTRRLGWFTRARPLVLDDGRMLVGLYSDGFLFSLVARTDDRGKTWQFSEPIAGAGNIQPTIAQRKDGTLVAYMRDNGPPPRKMHVAQSKDRGETWSKVVDHPVLNNPGSAIDLVRCKNGDWLCAYNDHPDDRHMLAVSLSDDEGRSWKWTNHLIVRPIKQGSFDYPSILEGHDGNIHVTYRHSNEKPYQDEPEGISICYATFNKAWIKSE